jgi:hypothetical protein
MRRIRSRYNGMGAEPMRQMYQIYVLGYKKGYMLGYKRGYEKGLLGSYKI